jgi:Nuclear transport factor 2 (NTF2) domain
MRRFMQTFVLAPRQPKKYYVQNDIFRYQDEVFDDASDDVDEDDRSSSQIYGDTNSNVVNYSKDRCLLAKIKYSIVSRIRSQMLIRRLLLVQVHNSNICLLQLMQELPLRNNSRYLLVTLVRHLELVNSK